MHVYTGLHKTFSYVYIYIMYLSVFSQAAGVTISTCPHPVLRVHVPQSARAV
jgi:hypothetical protein